MASVFTPEHTPLDRIFAANSTYHIPAYQRPYSWEAIGSTGRDNQVIQMWDDLWSFFEQNRTSSREYFLGSMVIIEATEKIRTFDVIDGQQRLTTLLLLFSAMRCYLRELAGRVGDQPEQAPVQRWIGKAIQTLESFIYNEEGASLVPDLKLKIERTVGANYNEVLERAVACEKDGLISALDKKYQPIALRYFKNRDYFLRRLRESFPSRSPAEFDIQRFDDFFKFLRTRVALVLIKTTDFGTAYRIFEILNNRGLPLSNLDLLRNFILEQLAGAGIQDPDERWEHLEEEYLFTEDFVVRWVESVTAEQTQTSAFNDAQRIYRERYRDSPGEKKIETFYRDLELNLAYYTLLADERNIEHLPIRNMVSFIKALGNERYSKNLLLALFRQRRYQGGEDGDLAAFLRSYRSYALSIFLLGRFSSQRIYQAVSFLNSDDLTAARATFLLSPQEENALSVYFAGPIESNEHARVLLGAYVRHCDENETDVVTQDLHYESCTLEHIIPQNPAPGTNWLRDFDAGFRAEYTYSLGNMTLLTQARNAANKNYDFAKKRLIYAKAKLPMTVKLGAMQTITPDDIRARHQEIVSTLRTIFLA